MFKQAGFFAPLWTDLDKVGVSLMPEVIIVDTMGELRRLYAIADVVFVGKSLVNLGGQNPLEPAALKKPVLFGPHMFNFKAIAEQLVREGGALQVANEEELVAQAKTLLPNAKRSKEMGIRAYRMFHMNRGAVDKTMGVIERFL
jgi:3-deoxy-D-manno-octulosonic-acid transferase